jgi:ribonuclease HI
VSKRDERLLREILEGLTWKDAARRAGISEERARGFLESVARFAGAVGSVTEFGLPDEGGARAASGKALPELVLHTDGASLGNPGPGGAGGVISTPEGDVVEEFHEHLGRVTSNVAEYEAVRIGVAKAIGYGARRVTLRLDSELVANQLMGRYKIKDRKLIDAYLKVERLLSELDGVVVEPIPREDNTRADRLAEIGARQGEGSIG